MVEAGAPARVVIREATEADLPRLLQLYHELSQMGSTPEAAAREVTPEHRAALRALHDDPRATCFVVEAEGQVQGTLTLYVLPNITHGGRPYALVESVVVAAERRGGGLGARLMAHAERVAGERGCYRVILTSNVRRVDAHRFYERIGYHPSHKGMSKYAEERG
ncbi:MAG: GNAT family N-acetyltransferase [Dehalococcoidia bacterium]